MTALLSFHHNGAEASAAPVTSRALHYGDGVFRTMLRYEGHLLDAEAQIDKLLADAAGIGLPTGDSLRMRLHEEIDRIVAEAGTVVLKAMLVRGGEGRGYRPAQAEVDRYLYAYLPPLYPADSWRDGVTVERSSFVLSDQPALAGIKHLNRLEQVMAYRAASPAAQEILLGDANGNLVCGGRSNLFIVHGGVLLTPELLRQGVCGLMREKVMRVAAALGIECRIGLLSAPVVESADEVFVTNSLIGIWPVRQFDSRPFAAPGPITRRLRQALAHPRLIAR